jgi:cell fate (sporulation/competence/biofilm development) regulator YlbF (YheA/YmcA/DUF963 family)
MDREALEAELTDLRRKLHKRQNVPGFAKNAEAIQARIAEIEAELNGPA